MTDLLHEFFQETDRNLCQVSEDLERWAQAPSDPAALNGVFRIVHNVKATCHVLGFARIEALAHAAEDVLYWIREGVTEASPEAVAVIREAMAQIESLLEGIRIHRSETPGDDQELIRRISAFGSHGGQPSGGLEGEPPFQGGHLLPDGHEITEAGLVPETEIFFTHLPEMEGSSLDPSTQDPASMTPAESALRDIAPPAEGGPPPGAVEDQLELIEEAKNPAAPDTDAADLADDEGTAFEIDIEGLADEAAVSEIQSLETAAFEEAPLSAAESPQPEDADAEGLSTEPAPDPEMDSALELEIELAAEDAPQDVLEGAPEDAREESLEETGGPLLAPLTVIHPNPRQPRQRMEDEGLQALAESISHHGVLQPILVRHHPQRPGHFEIVAGERRWRAAALAGIQDAPITLADLSDEVALELSLVENLQREDLSPIEEAEGYQQLMARFDHTQEEVAKRIGKSRSHVANALRLLKLPPAVKEMLQRGAISAGHARALLAFEEPEPIAQKVVDRGLSVRETEDLARQPAVPVPARSAEPEAAALDDELKALERELSESLGSKVRIRMRGETGEIRLQFRSLHDFEKLMGRLRQVKQSTAA